MPSAVRGKSLRVLLALAGGFALSCAGLGVLWIGVPWHYQALMFFPFLLLGFAVTRTGGGRDNVFLLVLCGAVPLGALMALFRDRNDSHLMPILMLCAWLTATLVGHYVATQAARAKGAP